MSFLPSAFSPLLRRLGLYILVSACGLLGAGCIAVLDYQPNERALDELGIDTARERLRETLIRAVNPPVQTVELTNETLTYKWHPLVGIQIFFIKLSRVEVYENHVVFLRGAGNEILGTIIYGTAQDAKLFADLVMSFRARYLQRREALPPSAATHPSQKHLKLARTGSGFVINAQGEVLTNQHVTQGCEEVRVRFPFQNDQPAVPIVQDSQNDLALLRLPTPPAQWLIFRDGRDIQQGDEIITVGFPLSNDLASGAKVTTGTVSALAGMGDNTGWLQVSAPVQSGNSGGPLLDMSGHVVGVMVGSFPPDRMPKGKIPQNVNFAIKASVAQSFLEAIGTPYDTAASTRQLSTTEISARARQSTVLVECWK